MCADSVQADQHYTSHYIRILSVHILYIHLYIITCECDVCIDANHMCECSMSVMTEPIEFSVVFVRPK